MSFFSIKEMIRSNEADRRGINNKPGEREKSNLLDLIDNVLNPLRAWYGGPIRVNSGFRCIELNKAVGGAKNSQHTKGEAADITSGSREGNKRLFEYIKDNLPYDQLIDENNYTWIHVSYKREGNRHQVLKL